MATTMRWYHEGLLDRIGDFWLGRKIFTGGTFWESGKSEVYFRRGTPVVRFWKWYRINFKWLGGPRRGTRRYGVGVYLWRLQANGPARSWGALIWHAGLMFRDLHPSPMRGQPRVSCWAGKVRQ